MFRSRLLLGAKLSAVVCIFVGAALIVEPALKTSGIKTPDTNAQAHIAKLVSAEIEGSAALTSSIDPLVDSSNPGTNCAIVRVGTRNIVERNNDQALEPASGIKLITASVALEKLDAKSYVTTEIRGKNDAGVVSGDLYVIGSGDPLIETDAYAAKQNSDNQSHTALDALAAKVKALGVTEIKGNLVVDDSRYDTERSNPNWNHAFVPREVAPLGPLMLNDNHDDSGTPKTDDPALYFGARFKELLNKAGVAGVKAVAKGSAPSGTELMTSIDSLPLGDIVRQMLSYSNNTTAEMLVKELAIKENKSPTTANGLSVIKSWLETNKLNSSSYVQVDGSGLSSKDRVNCAQLLDVYMHNAGEIRDKLAVAGKEGTLHDRLLKAAATGIVRAKTGSLDNSASITGELRVDGEPVITFCAIRNDITGITAAHSWQDSFANAIASFNAPYAANLARQ